MNTPLIVGITGGIGGGKSTLSDLLREHGYEVYNSDLEARRLQNEHPEIRQQLCTLFGNSIYGTDGLDRLTLSKLVFGQKDLLTKLNAIVHPVVKADFMHWIDERSLQHKILFIESAILYESSFDALVNRVILMTASEEIRIRRVMKRDGVTEDAVHARMRNQMPEYEKERRAHYIIHSDDNFPLIDKMHRILVDLLHE